MTQQPLLVRNVPQDSFVWVEPPLQHLSQLKSIMATLAPKASTAQPALEQSSRAQLALTMDFSSKPARSHAFCAKRTHSMAKWVKQHADHARHRQSLLQVP